MRENARDRGRRLVSEGRLVVRRVDTSEIVAACRGDSGEIYRLGYRDARWWCECPAKTQCGHLYALQLVCVGPVGAWVDLNDLLQRDAEVGSRGDSPSKTSQSQTRTAVGPDQTDFSPRPRGVETRAGRHPS